MNNKYWKKFYKGKNAEREPSDFAKSIQEIAGKQEKLIFDLGSGNGRDSVFFAEKGHTVISVDPNSAPYKNHDNLMYWKMTIDYFIKRLKTGNTCSKEMPTVLYSRFFIHAINKEQTKQLVNAVRPKTYFIAEFRIEGDEPKIYKDHKRTLWNPKEFAELFNNDEWERCTVQTGRGFAKYKDEDPLVMRIIAKKK